MHSIQYSRTETPPPPLHPIFKQYYDYVYYVSSVSLLIYNNNVITYVS